MLRIVSCGYNLPFKFTPIQRFWAWESKISGSTHEDESLGSNGLGLLLPFGLRCSPGMLSKVLKLVVAPFRVAWENFDIIYMDDNLIQGSYPPQVYLHAQVATLLFMVLG